MMAQVPYSPVPQVQPTSQGIAEPSVNPPPAAFGVGIAESVSNLGKAMESSADRLFARAISIQQMNNETEAREADANYMIQAGKLHADFSALAGKSAQDAFPKYQEDLNNLRQDIRKSLSNPMAAKMYDSSSLSTMGRTIFNGAGHAAQQNKVWQGQVSAAQHKAWMDQVLSNPDDVPMFGGALDNAKNTAIADSVRNGNSPDDDATKLLVKQRQSEIWSSKIEGLARRDPKSAKELMEEALKREYILGQDYEKLSPKVDTMLHSVVSRNVSDSVNSGWAPYVTMDQVGRSVGIEQSLVDVIKRAQQNHPELQFMIAPQGGKRTQAEQNVLFAQGRTAPGQVVTWTTQSEHITGRAADVVATNKGTSQAAVRAAMEEAAQELGVSLANKPTLAAKDPGHFELAGDYNTKNYKAPPPPSLDARQKAAEDYVKAEYNDPKMTYATRDRVRSDFDRQIADQRHEQQQNFIGLSNYVYDNTITNRDAILNNPSTFAVYSALDEPHKKRVDNLVAALAKQPTQETPEKATNTQRILNMSTQLSGKRDQFLELDPAALLEAGVVSTSGMKSIYAKQRQIQEGQANDSRRLTHAMQISQSYLKANSIVRGSDEDLQFTGAMNQWLTDFESQKKAFPSDEEIRKKAAELTTSTGGGWFGFGGRYGYEPTKEFTKEFTDWFKAHPSNPTKKDPTVEDLARAYQYSLTHPNWKNEK